MRFHLLANRGYIFYSSITRGKNVVGYTLSKEIAKTPDLNNGREPTSIKLKYRERFQALARVIILCNYVVT